MNAHVYQTETVDATPDSATCAREPLRGISTARVSGRALTSRILATAVTAHASIRSYAASLEVSSRAVEHWCDPEHSAAITLGDLLTGRRAVERAVLTASLAVLDDRGSRDVNPLDTVVRLGGDVARLSEMTLRATRGRIDPAHVAEIVRELDGIEQRCALLRRALGGQS